MKTNITGTVDPKVHREYFLGEFKERFGHLNYSEEMRQKGKEDQIILTIQSPSENLGNLRVFLSDYEITISFPKLSFHSHFDAANSINFIALDADASIPPRISALDFIKKIIEDRVFIRCYKHKGKIESVSIIDRATGKTQEAQSILSRPIKSLFLQYDKVHFLWSGTQMEAN